MRRQGRLVAAEPLLRHALAVQQRSGGRPLALADTLLGLGALLRDSGQASEAVPLLREALERRERLLPAGNWLIAEARLELAVLLAERQDANAEAGALVQASLAPLAATLGDEDERTRRGRRLLAALQGRSSSR